MELKSACKKCEICSSEIVISYVSDGSGSGNALRKKYCSRQCKKVANRKKSSKRLAISCQICLREFFVPKCFASSKFCSNECRFIGNGNALRKKRTEKPCEFCKTAFEVVVDGESQRRFCSLDCARKSRRKRTQVTCAICGVSYEKKTSLVKPNNYCGHACQFEAQSCGLIKCHSEGRKGRRIDLDSTVYRSSLEADYVRYCKFVGKPFEYEPKTFRVDVGRAKGVCYTPDFYHSDDEEYLEIKGTTKIPSMKRNLNCVEILKKSGVRIRVLMMKDFYDFLKSEELFHKIPNLEHRDYNGTRHLIIDEETDKVYSKDTETC